MITPKLSASTVAAKRDPQTYEIIGAALAVHQEMGSGFLETVYQEPLEIEFSLRGIQFIREHPIPIKYRGHPLKTLYRCDFLCHGEILVELKAIKHLTEIEEAQVIHCLKATGLTKALILNFGSPSLEHKRIIHGPSDLFGPVQRKTE